MKQLLIICLFLLGVNVNVQAQNYDRQVGVDGSKFLAQFFNFGGSSNNFSPYYLTLRKLGDTHNKRFGFGTNLSLNSNGASSTGSVNIRFGKERFKDFGNANQWRAFYGVDFKTGIDLLLNNDNNRAQLRFGVAPLMGLQFRINDRISLSTETAFNFWLAGGFASEESVFSLNTTFDPPLSLFVQYEFKKKEKGE